MINEQYACPTNKEKLPNNESVLIKEERIFNFNFSKINSRLHTM